MARLCLTLLPPPWTVARQAPLSMGFSRQEHWSALPFPSPADLPDPGIEPERPALAGGFFTTEPPGKPCFFLRWVQIPKESCAPWPICAKVFLGHQPFLCQATSAHPPAPSTPTPGEKADRRKTVCWRLWRAGSLQGVGTISVLPDTSSVRDIIKENCAEMCMNLKTLTQGNRKEKNKYRIVPHTCGIQKSGMDEPIYKAEAETEMARTNMQTPRVDAEREQGAWK